MHNVIQYVIYRGPQVTFVYTNDQNLNYRGPQVTFVYTNDQNLNYRVPPSVTCAVNSLVFPGGPPAQY
jgi:hypothetical protein